MGAHSTINVTETRARTYLLEHVIKASREETEAMMDVALYDRLYNCRIVNDNNENNDDSVL